MPACLPATTAAAGPCSHVHVHGAGCGVCTFKRSPSGALALPILKHVCVDMHCTPAAEGPALSRPQARQCVTVRLPCPPLLLCSVFSNASSSYYKNLQHLSSALAMTS